MKLTAVRTSNDTELFAGRNWKQLGAVLFILLVLLLVIGIGLWWMLDSESELQLTLILSSEYMSVRTCTRFLLIRVHIINKYIDVTRSDIDLEYPHFINTCYSCVFPVLIQVSISFLITWIGVKYDML